MYCSKCGKENNNNGSYCTNCGILLNNIDSEFEKFKQDFKYLLFIDRCTLFFLSKNYVYKRKYKQYKESKLNKLALDFLNAVVNFIVGCFQKVFAW